MFFKKRKVFFYDFLFFHKNGYNHALISNIPIKHEYSQKIIYFVLSSVDKSTE